uniref:Uncharacterized protein n=1 Tax=Anopheles dirus TaxID=7168 RepID=A0A182N659_9DIPT
MSEQREGDAIDGTGDTTFVQMLNKRPRLLSFQGLSSHSRSLAERDVALPMAGTSSSSLEHINRREQLANDLRSWQEAQIAACVEDNVVNMVVERYLFFFEQRNNRNEEAPAARVDAELLLEDEAIGMAINERGLQAVAAAEMGEPSGSAPPQPPQQALPSALLETTDRGRALPANFILETAVAAAIQEKGLITNCAEADETSDSDDSVQQGEDEDAR